MHYVSVSIVKLSFPLFWIKDSEFGQRVVDIKYKYPCVIEDIKPASTQNINGIICFTIKTE